MAIIDRAIYKKIEYYLYNHQDIAEKIQALKDEILEGGSRELIEWGDGISYRSDPTANKVVKLCHPNMLEDERWLKVVERVKDKYKDTLKSGLIELKYIQKRGEVVICQALNIERTTYYRWREEIVVYAALVATQEGLIKVC